MRSIEVNNISKVISGTTILKDINLVLEEGKIYGVYGHNGSGKTMLFRTLSGLIKPTTGTINIFGQQLHKDIDFPKSIGVLIENPKFWPNYTGKEVLKTLANIKRIINDEDISKSLERVGLNPNDLRTVKKYSLGMRQRLGIAQAIMEKPDIIILDEPTSALDEDGVNLIYNILLEEKKRGAVVIISSHNKADIDTLCDYKIKIDGGKIVDKIGG
ncbi:ABC-2 type transport system ATP-binding protein [Clostridium sp. USBA 49]|jgi:ABC-2 type transport system ATP-binding protein|uniref:ABC transporter ATP-binding protein n=1 Tax=Clostridium sp. USBA 49 TaxID=1881060 RepID=UPI00099AC82A|nr:ABC transporter ATP-binding protein [Clostridium sp. USBA 49]SKA92222.1 ABC-2 type transport system ATP-binding protein [Clostridium sp. USBA 49]